MNYLAHAYLSFEQPGILTGNIISDFVKGKKKFSYSARIQQGISLHRFIDNFTDIHAATRRGKAYFRDRYGLYAGAFMDIVYDHFLAVDAGEFPGAELDGFSLRTYERLQKDEAIFPDRFRQLFYYMRTENWLLNYRRRDRICRSFGGLARRALYIDDHRPACTIFEERYEELRSCYEDFFPGVKQFALLKLHELGSE
ncbi:MAG TPA: ACP phosphodiesterase [Puia sp.]|nr:ACP phosphodiesterase [Puia sp.]